MGESHRKQTLSAECWTFAYGHLAQPGFLGGSVVKNPPAKTGDSGDTGSIPGLGKSLGRGKDNPLQYSYLEYPRDRGAWWVAVHGLPRVGQDWATEHTHTHTHPPSPTWGGRMSDTSRSTPEPGGGARAESGTEAWWSPDGVKICVFM